MGLLGKVVGGALGFALGGPVGAVVGALAGHLADRAPEDSGRAERRVRPAFTGALLVLGARMPQSEDDEPGAGPALSRRILGAAGAPEAEAPEDAGVEPYAAEIAALLDHDPVALEEILDGLFYVAVADAPLKRAEVRYLRRVARAFGLGDAAFERVRAHHQRLEDRDPYELLGIAPGADDAQARAAWRRASRECHPDVLAARGAPPKAVAMATRKMAAINAAYERIRRQRGMA